MIGNGDSERHSDIESETIGSRPGLSVKPH